MEPNEYPITLTTFPRLGTRDDFITPYYPPSGERLRSQFLPDQIANPHIRFPTLAANIRARRGRKVEINVPVFKDIRTPSPFKDPTIDYDLHNWPEDSDVRNGAAKDDHIYMDAMAFGMGSCCLQITFQAKNITEGRRLYDQLSPLGPIMLALTAATPIYKGFLADTDVRWDQISRAVDDRTPEELGEIVSPTDSDHLLSVTDVSLSHFSMIDGKSLNHAMLQILLTSLKTADFEKNIWTLILLSMQN